MAKKVKSLIHPALHVFMRTGPTDHFPSQPIMGSDPISLCHLTPAASVTSLKFLATGSDPNNRVGWDGPSHPGG